MNIELLEVLKESLINQKSITAVDIDIIDNAIKELKALEIIKRYYYGNGVLFGEMTQEELNFLKEVLFDGK